MAKASKETHVVRGESISFPTEAGQGPIGEAGNGSLLVLIMAFLAWRIFRQNHCLEKVGVDPANHDSFALPDHMGSHPLVLKRSLRLASLLLSMRSA